MLIYPCSELFSERKKRLQAAKPCRGRNASKGKGDPSRPLKQLDWATWEYVPSVRPKTD